MFRFINGIKDLIKKINLKLNLLYSENVLSLHCKRRREHQLLLHIFNTLHFILYIFKQIYTLIRLTFSKFVAILLFQNFIIIFSKRKTWKNYWRVEDIHRIHKNKILMHLCFCWILKWSDFFLPHGNQWSLVKVDNT